jgi:hypothetical protein
MTFATLPERVARFLESPTPAGSGLHYWLMSAANMLCRHVAYQEAFERLLAAGRRAGRASVTEIRHTLDKAHAEKGETVSGSWRPGGATSFVAKKWPERNTAAIEAVVKDGPGVSDLWERSPIRWDDDEPHTEEIIDELFPGNPCLCVGRHAKEFRSDSREALRGKLSKCSHIVPSPMEPLGGQTKAGHWSEKCNDAVERRRFIVTEFDQEEWDNQAAIIWHLRQFGRLVMVVNSMGKSLHAWWYCQGSDESEGSQMRKFFNYAVSLGADRAGWVLSQYMRMPDGTREKGENKGQRQSVIYFNSEGISKWV